MDNSFEEDDVEKEVVFLVCLLKDIKELNSPKIELKS